MNTFQKNSKKGFTLIEILIVIGLISILASVIFVAINPARQFAQSRDSQRISNVNAILNAIGQFIADNKGNLPAIPEKEEAPAEIGINLCRDLVPTYLPSLPTDPKSSRKGESIKICSEIVSGAVEYYASQDINGRITIEAKKAEITKPILITR